MVPPTVQETLIEPPNVEMSVILWIPAAVMLVLVEGFAYKEAADIIGCPMGTLTSRLGRGREALLCELGESP